MADQRREDRGATRGASEAAPDPKQVWKVAIIGGGCAGMAAAWQLASQPGFDVTVYERSWRLGGKGASGRDEDGRILEHGLHVWLGFYENAFKMIRECYAEVAAQKWGPGGRTKDERLAHGSFEEAFVPQPNIGVTEKDRCGDQLVWTGFFPPAKGLPGDPIDAETNPFTIASYLTRCVDLVKTLVLSVVTDNAGGAPGMPRPGERSILDEVIDREHGFDPAASPGLLVDLIAERARDGSLTLVAALLHAIAIAERILQDFDKSAPAAGPALNLVKALMAQARKQLGDLITIDEKLRWKTEIIDIVMTITVGLYRDRVLLGARGLDALNDFDYRDWLKKHGATQDTLDSRFITGIYDLVFAYEGGDRNKPRLAAGVALRGALRMFFTYRGAMFWTMRSGMGDAVFAPLYRVLLEGRTHRDTGKALKPVKFHFLHTLRDITFDTRSRNRRTVTGLVFSVPDDPAVDNPKLRALDDFGCWPEDDRQLRSERRSAETTLKSLEVGTHFDAVIFALGRDDFASILRDKKSLPRRWSALMNRNQTVATKAAQVWMQKTVDEMGWHGGPAIISALGTSFDTWADMTHTLPSERQWRKASGRGSPDANRAKSVAYFCGVMSDADAEADAAHAEPASVRAALDQLLNRELRGLWPAAYKDGQTPLDERVGDPHMQANATGSDRYSLSLPGTIADRISPLDLDVLNMTVAGDWTACGLDVGCVEAAVMSGMLAAHALTAGQPTLDSIVGYDHP